MDKETLSNYGWIVICVLVLAVMLALASPFGSFVAVGVKSTTAGLFETNQKALNTTGLVNIDDQNFDDGTIPLGGTYTTSEGIVLSGNSNDSFPETPTDGDTYEYGDYIYKYNNYYNGSSWTTSTAQNGWGVRVKDTTKSSYGKILTKIAGKPITNMYNTFTDCTSLTTAPTIPSSVTDMSYTFYNCTSLTTAPTIPSNVTQMYSTFRDCTNLTTAPTMPNGVTNLWGTFSGCTALKTYTGSTNADGDFSNYKIPNSARNMIGTFSNCKSLTTAPEIPNSVIDMTETFEDCTSLITAPPTIPNSVKDMYCTFYGCTKLTTAPTIPNSVTSMYGTFLGCTALKTYTGSTNADGDFSNYKIPRSVRNMSRTFCDCTSLKIAPTIPSSVTGMYEIFRDCYYLTGTITINANLTKSTQYFQCFLGTAQKITLTGTSKKLNDIASRYWNVTVATTP